MLRHRRGSALVRGDHAAVPRQVPEVHLLQQEGQDQDGGKWIDNWLYFRSSPSIFLDFWSSSCRISLQDSIDTHFLLSRHLLPTWYIRFIPKSRWDAARGYIMPHIRYTRDHTIFVVGMFYLHEMDTLRARLFVPLLGLLVQWDRSACFPWTAKFFLIQMGFCFAAAVYVLFHMSLLFGQVFSQSLSSSEEELAKSLTKWWT